MNTTNKSYQYDLVIIGSGPGGYVAAIYAAQQGLKTAVIEKRELGGTCLNRGCIPTKALLHTGEVLDGIADAKKFGITVEKPSFDLSRVYKYKDKTVKKLRKGIAGLFTHHGVVLHQGIGTLVDPHTVKVETEDHAEELTTGAVILAFGSEVAIPPIPGLTKSGYWTSDTLLEANKELPARITIIGGGVIGVESATILHDLGVEVTIVELLPQLVPKMDSEISALLKSQLERMKIKVFLSTEVKEVGLTKEGKQCTVIADGKKQVIESDEILAAVGRRPVLDPESLHKLGIRVKKGAVEVNAFHETSLSGVYAIGDLTGGWMLAHAASAQALVAVDHITGRKNFTSLEVIPGCIYTRPEIGFVGMTKEEAEEKGIAVQVESFPLAANSKASIAGAPEGLVKLVTEKETGAIIGGHIMGLRATDMIGEIALAVRTELTVEELGGTVHPHPTVNEAIMETAHMIEGFPIHTIRKA